jgi:hypothetical protein
MKLRWGRKEYIESYTRNERNVFAWLKAAFWKLKGIRGGNNKGSCSLSYVRRALSLRSRLSRKHRYGDWNFCVKIVRYQLEIRI